MIFQNDMSEFTFEQLINIGQLKQLLESHHCLSGMAYGLCDNNENNMVSVGWQDICTRFHRAHPVSSGRCRAHKAYITANPHEPEDGFFEYRCGNGMVDAAMPITIEGRHLATFFIGQFFYADEPPDRAFFLHQAREFGFDPDQYLDALERVPLLSREHVRANLVFLHTMVRFMAESGLKSLRLGLTLANEREQCRLIEEWHAIFGFALDLFHEAAFVIDRSGCFHYVNQEACRSLGYGRDELIGMTVPDIDPDFTNEMVLQSIKRLHEVGTHTFETRHRTRDGRIFPVEITATLFEHDGVTYNLSLVRDISERKQAEQQELRTRELFLETLLDTTPIPIYYKDREGRYLGFNKAFEEFFGAPKEQLIGRTVFDISPPGLAEMYHRQDTALFEQGGIQRYEFMVRNTKGEMRNVVFNKAVFTDHDGNPSGVIGAIADITEHEMAEQRLREALEFSEGVINAIPDLLFEVDRNGRYLNVWTQKPELLAIPKELLLGKTVHEVLAPEAASIAMAGIGEAEEKGFSFGNILRIDLPQGTHWFEQSLSRKPGGDPSDARFLALSRDVTERKRMEKMLRRHEREFRTLVENSPDVIVRYGRDLRRLYVNPVFAAMVEGGAEALTGKSPTEFPVDSDNAAFFQQKLEEVFAHGKALEFEMRWSTRNGAELCNLFSVTPEFGEDGELESVLAIGRDITELRRSSNKLLEKKQRLAELAIELSMAEERERRRIAANLHDIVGQDLALARIKLGLLSKKLRAHEERELLEDAHKLMNGVIKSVRSLTHLVNPPILQSSGLEAALQWLGRQMGAEYGLMVEFRDDQQEKPLCRKVHADLYFAVRELLINVVKHAGTKSATVSVFRTNDTYTIVVEDKGCGFAVDTSMWNPAGSEGFGLFNIKRKTLYLGGALEMESSPGNGARMTIKMPLMKAANGI